MEGIVAVSMLSRRLLLEEPEMVCMNYHLLKRFTMFCPNALVSYRFDIVNYILYYTLVLILKIRTLRN